MEGIGIGYVSFTLSNQSRNAPRVRLARKLRGTVMINNILVPLDGSALAEAALPYAKAIAARTGASVMLVRAAQNKSPLGDVTYDQQHHTIEQAEDYLSLVAAELVAHGLDVRTGVPYGGSAAEWMSKKA